MKTLALCFASYTIAVAAFAQETGSLSKELVAHWETSKTLSLAVAEAMPDESYSFKATPAEMSFGGQMNHIAQANGNYCATAIGAKNPITKPADETKATAAKVLAQSYDYCIESIKGLSDADLQKQVTARGGQISKFELFWGGFTHAAHHRGQAEVYLRLKGVTPPTYKF
jgi:uncharacterized damage-inducible protein DinB